MRLPSENEAISKIVEALADWTCVNREDVQIIHKTVDIPADAIVHAGQYTFVVEWKSTGNPGTVAIAALQVKKWANNSRNGAIPLVAVPFMGEEGRRQCHEAGVQWMDLSGNARIIAPGLRIIIDGRENHYKKRGRISSEFSPKGSRVVRWLLINSDQFFKQVEIARNTEMDEGYTSRIVHKLEDEGYIIRDRNGAVKPKNPDLLLDAWHEKYNFFKHEVIKGHIPSKSGSELLRNISAVLSNNDVEYAATGLAASWLLNRFAGFRVTSIYLREPLDRQLLERLSFNKEERGSNIWFVLPNDTGVFQSTFEKEKIRCVHPVQIYLDLKNHPERSMEAAEKLQASHLNWGKTDE
jgi:transcriptional regulator with AbiEi antitoxin domain of type IV toxin-antitoxin system